MSLEADSRLEQRANSFLLAGALIGHRTPARPDKFSFGSGQQLTKGIYQPSRAGHGRGEKEEKGRRGKERREEESRGKERRGPRYSG